MARPVRTEAKLLASCCSAPSMRFCALSMMSLIILGPFPSYLRNNCAADGAVGKLRYAVTVVPMFSPFRMREMLPGTMRSNTRMGSLLSMHSEVAVESMTCSSRESTSR